MRTSNKSTNTKNGIQLSFLIPLSDVSKSTIPFFDTGIPAGFPSPADDFDTDNIDLNKELIRHPQATFMAWVKGDSMKNAGLNDGDLIIIDRSLEHKNNQIALCCIDKTFTIKRIKVTKGKCWLIPENEDFKPIEVTEENELIIWGVITHVIKKFV